MAPRRLRRPSRRRASPFPCPAADLGQGGEWLALCTSCRLPVFIACQLVSECVGAALTLPADCLTPCRKAVDPGCKCTQCVPCERRLPSQGVAARACTRLASLSTIGIALHESRAYNHEQAGASCCTSCTAGPCFSATGPHCRRTVYRARHNDSIITTGSSLAAGRRPSSLQGRRGKTPASVAAWPPGAASCSACDPGPSHARCPRGLLSAHSLSSAAYW